MEMKYKSLLEAQVGEFPDSIMLSDYQMFDALRSTVPDWLVDHKFEDWNKYEARYEMGVFVGWYYEEWKENMTEQARAQWARSAFLYKTQYPKGFFYVCGKRPDGTYRYVGYRFGLNDHEYASGFIGMEYKPQGESK
jgi:hypothetical protein